MMAAQFGMIGLGTMGRNLVLNMADKGIVVSGYDRDPAQQQRLTEEGKGKPVTAVASVQDLVNSLETPRRIMMLVPAGKIVDAVIDEVMPFLKPGDILIDGGNSHFTDTTLRYEKLKSTGIHFTGMGVSGGEDGARTGPSLMPGGNLESYQELKYILEKIAAITEDGPCVSFIGEGAAGHYTKMVHNGIEYAMMQLISEHYWLLKTNGGFSNQELAAQFAKWNAGPLQSFLVEITATVLAKKDEPSGKDLVDLVLDKAKQKGTGMWTSQSAMDLNIPIPSIDTAVSMRYISALKDDRVLAAKNISRGRSTAMADRTKLVEHCKNSLQFGFLLAYAQGLHLLKAASDHYKYGIEISEVARVWKGGCIIRSILLDEIRNAYIDDPVLNNIMLSPRFNANLQLWRKDTVKLIALASENAIAMPATSSSLQYFDAYHSANLPANLIQAQRDHFGAHGYERTDQPGNFHSDWNNQTS